MLVDITIALLIAVFFVGGLDCGFWDGKVVFGAEEEGLSEYGLLVEALGLLVYVGVLVGVFVWGFWDDFGTKEEGLTVDGWTGLFDGSTEGNKLVGRIDGLLFDVRGMLVCSFWDGR